MIEKHFGNVIGQESAKARLRNAVKSFTNGGGGLNPLLIAEAGMGKTHMGKAYGKALLEENPDLQVLATQPDQLRTPDGAQMVFDLMDPNVNSKPYFIWIDEAHKLFERKTVWLERISNLFMKVLDGTYDGRLIEVIDGTAVRYESEKGIIMFSTNFPEKLDKSGAFQSRLDRVELDYYNEEETIDILKLMLADHGFKDLRENTISMIAKCARGTARRLEKIVKELAMMHKASGKPQFTINRGEVLEALLLTKMFPLGLIEDEVKLLAMGIGRRILDRTIFAAMPKIERPALRRSKGYLMNLQFIDDTSKGITTSPRGERYLESIAKDQFPNFVGG